MKRVVKRAVGIHDLQARQLRIVVWSDKREGVAATIVPVVMRSIKRKGARDKTSDCKGVSSLRVSALYVFLSELFAESERSSFGEEG